MMALLIGMEHFHWFEEGSGRNPEGWDLGPLNIRQVSIFFTVYVFFQVWNQINARSLTPDMSGFSGLFKNRDVPGDRRHGGRGAGADHQRAVRRNGLQRGAAGWLDWLCVLAGTASVLAFGEVMRRVRLAMKPTVA